MINYTVEEARKAILTVEKQMEKVTEDLDLGQEALEEFTLKGFLEGLTEYQTKELEEASMQWNFLNEVRQGLMVQAIYKHIFPQETKE